MEEQNIIQKSNPIASETDASVSNKTFQSGLNPKWIMITGVIVALILVSIGGAYMLGKNQKNINTTTDKSVNNESVTITPTDFPTSAQESAVSSTITPTPDKFAKWKNYSDLKYNFSFKYPTDWSVEMKDYAENNQRLINIIKNSSPSVVSLSFRISNDWAGNGDIQYQVKNYSVDGVPAYRIDSPKKEEQQLERYLTNIYFENGGKVYVFVCTHNWNQDYINTCNNILSSFKFTK